jgi:hypothetical protein
MNDNILVTYQPQVTINKSSLLSIETKNFFNNKKISVCKDKNHTQNLFETSSIIYGVEYFRIPLQKRYICDVCHYRLTAEESKLLNRKIIKEEESNNLPYLNQEKLLTFGHEITSYAKRYSGGLWGSITIEDAAIKILENTLNNLDETHPGYQAAKYLYSQGHQHKIEFLMRHKYELIGLDSIDDHITNLKDSLHCIKANDDYAKINSEQVITITASDFLNQNQEIKYLLGKLYILKAILELQIPFKKNKLKDILTYVDKANELINSEFIDLAVNYFYMLSMKSCEIFNLPYDISKLNKNLEVYKLKIRQLEDKIIKAWHNSENIKKHEYKNIEKQYCENNYAYLFTLLILTKVSTNKNDILNDHHPLKASSIVQDQVFSKLQEYASNRYYAMSNSNSTPFVTNLTRILTHVNSMKNKFSKFR